MFDGGDIKAPEPQDKKEATPVGSSSSARVFSMPEELRGKNAVLPEGPKKEAAPEALAPLIIPFALPPEPQQNVVIKKRVSPLLIAVLVLVLMAGTGAGVWWYVVTYASPPQVIENPTPDPDPVPEPDPEPTEPFPGTDTDSDGLTNIEELLYGTDFRSPDTDGDTFLDGNEVFHRYDPNGLAPSTLLDTGAVRVLERNDVPFTTYYPASWSVSAASDEAEVKFRSAESATITFSYEAKDALTDLDDWMKENDISTKGTEETMTKEGYAARSAEDGRTVYVDLGDWVVSAIYDLGEDNFSIEFLQTFKMMMNSVNGTDESDTDIEAVLEETGGEEVEEGVGGEAATEEDAEASADAVPDATTEVSDTPATTNDTSDSTPQS